MGTNFSFKDIHKSIKDKEGDYYWKTHWVLIPGFISLMIFISYFISFEYIYFNYLYSHICFLTENINIWVTLGWGMFEIFFLFIITNLKDDIKKWSGRDIIILILSFLAFLSIALLILIGVKDTNILEKKFINIDKNELKIKDFNKYLKYYNKKLYNGDIKQYKGQIMPYLVNSNNNVIHTKIHIDVINLLKQGYSIEQKALLLKQYLNYLTIIYSKKEYIYKINNNKQSLIKISGETIENLNREIKKHKLFNEVKNEWNDLINKIL